MRFQVHRTGACLVALLMAVGSVGCSDSAGTLAPAVDLSDADGAASAAAREGHGAPAEPPPGPAGSPPGPALPPDPATADPLGPVEQAFDAECHARSVYLHVLQELGLVNPFSNVAEAEGRHVSRLTALFVKRELPAPTCPYSPESVEVPDFAGVREACAYALLEERALLFLYDALLQQPLPQDAGTVFTNLRDATEAHHVVAFEACSSP